MRRKRAESREDYEALLRRACYKRHKRQWRYILFGLQSKMLLLSEYAHKPWVKRRVLYNGEACGRNFGAPKKRRA